MNKKAILLVNTGTPGSPSMVDVRKYLSEFLNDPRVIDLPWLARKILVNFIIVPFRSPKSAKLYSKIWTPGGSPLLVHSEALAVKLQAELLGSADVYLAMRYGNPSITHVIADIMKKAYDELVVLPLFPQYASSTTGSIVDAVKLETASTGIKVRFVDQFYKHDAFIKVFASRMAAYQPEKFDHIVFTYHGLPNRHLDKSHPGIAHSSCRCEQHMPVHGSYCYKATCYETTRLLAQKLGLKQGGYSVSFQSRLSRNWMEPFTDRVLVELAQQGKKRLLVAAPGFVADCLETILELGMEYSELFKANGGTELCLVESLNAGDDWAKALRNICSIA